MILIYFAGYCFTILVESILLMYCLKLDWNISNILMCMCFGTTVVLIPILLIVLVLGFLRK